MRELNRGGNGFRRVGGEETPTVDNLYAFIPLARFSGYRLFWSYAGEALTRHTPTVSSGLIGLSSF